MRWGEDDEEGTKKRATEGELAGTMVALRMYRMRLDMEVGSLLPLLPRWEG